MVYYRIEVASVETADATIEYYDELSYILLHIIVYELRVLYRFYHGLIRVS